MRQCTKWCLYAYGRRRNWMYHFSVFGSKHKIKRVSNFQVSCNNHIISSQKSVKYLGLNIDQSLSGEVIVNNIIKKVNSRLKFLYWMYRQANCLSETSRKTLSMALVQCHFDYSCSSWYKFYIKDVYLNKFNRL